MPDDRTAEAEVEPDAVEVPPEPAATGSRAEQLSTAVGRLRIGTGAFKLNERILMILGGVLAPLGLLLVVLGWYGAAHTPHLYEQMPYLISGGLLGLGFVFLGAFFYFTHWLTELVKEHRAQSATVVDAIRRLEDAVTGAGVPHRSNGHRPSEPTTEGDAEPVRLVATAKGTMAHRETCTVVAGKAGLREVDPAEGLLPCKLCDPYESFSTK